MVDTDRITGAAQALGGKLQGAVGDLTGSRRDSVEGRAREAAGQAENLYGQAKDTARDAAEHVADTARDLGGRIRDTVGGLVGSDDVEQRARRAAHDGYESASDFAEDAYARSRHALRRGSHEVGDQVAAYPLASLLVAGAVGFGLGLLVSTSRD